MQFIRSVWDLFWWLVVQTASVFYWPLLLLVVAGFLALALWLLRQFVRW